MIAKYRGWTIDTNKEVKGCCCVVKGKYYIVLDNARMLPLGFTDGPPCLEGFVKVHPASVGQFTGLKNYDFWEDDILESEDSLRKFIITYCDKSARWYLKGIGKAWCVYGVNWENFKKVGNVTDNPSLVEGK